MIKQLASLLIIFLLFSCQKPTMKTDSIFEQYAKTDRIDSHSFSNPSEAITTHLELDLDIDFDQKIITGIANYDLKLAPKASKIIIDTKDLIIDKITLDNGKLAEFSLGTKDDLLGQALTISLTEGTKGISIHYQTKPTAAALQWLSPQQTADKKHPFLFSQGQAILTRTWIPCQDSPGIRITYNAKVKVPKDLLPVMSAKNPFSKNDTGIYSFEMKQAIPPYLIALAVGDLSFGSIGKRCGVYAESSVLESATYEFEDTEKMLIVAENLYGPYLWDRYDIIVLPPSFPFGGMENPRLTFATPTIIAGDKSLTALIAHELAHSWSGNLVTNATWNDFWLNEGFTVYFERRIMEALYGKDYADMLALLGYQDLEADVKDIGHSHADTHLKLNLSGRDADDGMTDIAYEKGAYFLMSLEAQVGRENFDVFLKEYFNRHLFQTLTTEEFIDYLKTNLLEKHKVEANFSDWIYGPGIPANCPVPVSDKFSTIDDLIENQIKNKNFNIEKNTSEWNTHQWLHFIRHLPSDLAEQEMQLLDSKFAFSKSGNSEIIASWLELSIKNGYYTNVTQELEEFLIKVGRRKFLTPLYRALKEADNLDLAKSIYAKAKSNYHSVSVQTLDALLGD